MDIREEEEIKKDERFEGGFFFYLVQSANKLSQDLDWGFSAY